MKTRALSIATVMKIKM